MILKNLLTFVSPYNNIYVSPKERRKRWHRGQEDRLIILKGTKPG